MLLLEVMFDPKWVAGDVIDLGGKSYKITKKTSRNLAVTRYYWFNRIWDKYFAKKGTDV
jgi:hypothetical protein